MAVSRTAAIYEALKEELLDSKHPAGKKLGIDQIAQRFGASAGAVREALARLTSDRLVIAQPQRGFVVTPVSRADLIDLTQVRIDIETRCLANSIERGTLEWEGQMLAIWHKLSNTASGRDDPHQHRKWSALHADFHDGLIACCDSPWWMHLRDQMYMQAERYRRMIFPHVQVKRDINAEHGQILNLALGRDTQGACDALAKHLQFTTDILLAAHVPGLSEEEAKADVRS
ncbi:GntR family transcriptional regulator [Donghicola mangrovi]|uniref:GntR family transcriptional regulator n=1 Tax=Donghicola mangrovi TaxID=2729614 RepID=A0A850Q8U4_9RHOB|nr:GntR family transcriptional regulator [Donghicola mangrovi]NVO25566.1 GntR family transcriptional regulator [Donghicola mangrovi]